MASTWHRQILIEKMALEANISKTQAGQALDALLQGVEEALRSGDKVTLTGFGTFACSERKARTGRNPQTGASMHIPARRVPTFKAGAALKKATAQPAVAASTPDAWYSSTV